MGCNNDRANASNRMTIKSCLNTKEHKDRYLKGRFIGSQWKLPLHINWLRVCKISHPQPTSISKLGSYGTGNISFSPTIVATHNCQVSRLPMSVVGVTPVSVAVTILSNIKDPELQGDTAELLASILFKRGCTCRVLKEVPVHST